MERESERLTMRLWREGDFESYAAMYDDPEASKFIGGPVPRHEAWRKMASVLGHWQLRGYGFWALEEKETGELVGGAGVWRPEGWPELEIGYWLLPAHHGRGFATEAVLRSRKFAYEELDASTVVSYIHPDNEPSKRVAERAGATFEKMAELVTYGPHCVYRHPGRDG